MSLFDVIAAGQQGQCFALLSRRFMISEPEAAEAVRGLASAILQPFEAWVQTPRGMAAFLEAMSKAGYERALTSPGIFSNAFERDRGLHLLESFRTVRDIDSHAVACAAEASGLPYRIMLQMLPLVALFVMAALRLKLEQPAREILSRHSLLPLRRSADPFVDLADLIAWEGKGHRHARLASVLGGLFGRHTASATALPAALPLGLAAE